jgi:hypothetical protein
MRIWDITPEKLCRNHLLGEHSELHAIWSILTNNKKGFKNHPETLRWKGKLNALFLRNEQLVKEMKKRGYTHSSLLDKHLVTGFSIQNEYVEPLEDQIEKLKKKGCKCRV